MDRPAVSTSYRARMRVVIVFLVSVLISLSFVLAPTALADDDDEAEVDKATEMTLTDANDLVALASSQAESLSKIVYIMAPGEFAAQLMNANNRNAMTNIIEWYWKLIGRDAEEIPEASTQQATLADALIYNDGAPAKVGQDVLSGLALVLVLVYALIQLISTMQRDQGSIDGWVRLGISVTVGMLCVVYCQDILRLMDEVGTWLWTSLARSFSGVSADFAAASYPQVTNSTANGSFDLTKILIDVKSWAIKTVFRLIMLLVYYSIICAVYGLVFEITIRRVFMPLALADVTMEGFRSPGVRYGKAYLSCYLRMAMFCVLISLSAIACSWAIADVIGGNETTIARFISGQDDITNPTSYARAIHTELGSVGALICIQAATKAAMGSATQISREVFGV